MIVKIHDVDNNSIFIEDSQIYLVQKAKIYTFGGWVINIPPSIERLFNALDKEKFILLHGVESIVIVSKQSITCFFKQGDTTKVCLVSSTGSQSISVKEKAETIAEILKN